MVQKRLLALSPVVEGMKDCSGNRQETCIGTMIKMQELLKGLDELVLSEMPEITF